MAKRQTNQPQSKQPRFSKEHASHYYQLIERWVKEANLVAPAYSVMSRLRDAWLRSFWPREPLWAGVVKSVVSIDKNRGWTLTGSQRQVNKFTSVFRDADDGAGWRRHASLQALSYYTADIGSICEIGRDGEDGPLAKLWSVDPAKCELTGRHDYPLKYYPAVGKIQEWTSDDYMRAVSLESTDESMLGLGRCATDVALELATIMVAIWQHDKEMLFARMQKGLMLMKGISEWQWETAMQTNAEKLTAKEREFFGGLSIIFGDDKLDAKLIPLSNLWQGFSLQEWVDVLMKGYALIMGYDASEFWPMNYGALGRGTETEMQAMKATGKGGLDFVLAYQDNIQRQLPDTVLFEFEHRDDQGKALEAEVTEKWAKAINEMAKPSGPGMLATLSNEEKRQLLAQRGLIPDDWTYQEENVTVSDTDSTPNERVMRAATMFPGESIVRYRWPQNTIITIYDRSPIRLIPIKKRATLYRNEQLDFAITDADVDRAIDEARERVDDRYGDILEAEVSE